uniref:Protein SHORT HYPOCOTYL IN WHITE LIGHT 1 n=1 Tax=Kalanchoe fedtschenkoi TaxID=63787 RepID=A0A7N0UKL5_KALFE
MAGASSALSSPFTSELSHIPSQLSPSCHYRSSFTRIRYSTGFRSPRLVAPRVKLSEGPDEMEESFFGGDGLIGEESDEEDETESSVDLLFRFFQSMFKKVSKRAKKASRSVLPGVISPQLVSFAVDGVLLLASLSIVKALLEVVCTLGGTVFVVILLLRLIWAAVAYFQSNSNTFNQGGTSYGMT